LQDEANKDQAEADARPKEMLSAQSAHIGLVLRNCPAVRQWRLIRETD
jgi:hypothetical protein